MLRNTGSIISSLILLFCCELQSQSFSFQPHAFGANVFAGGIDMPRYRFVDIDGDNDDDLFILDRDERLFFYRNNNGVFLLESNQTFGLTVGSWFHFVDIDSDGDVDCFTNGDVSEVRLFTNIGSKNTPQFQMTIAALVDTAGLELFSERFSVPTFADIDADGDFDFFTGNSVGTITFYRNVGTATTPRFAFVTNEFDGIKIVGGAVSFPKAKHGASGIEFFDADSNGTLDLFWGDYFNPSLYFLKNVGTPTTPHYTLLDSTYPNEALISTQGFNIPQHLDIDRDGVVDLLAGSVFPNTGYDNLWFLKNIGTNAQPFYQLQTKNFLPMIDVGTRSAVAVADFDGDGIIDLCVSSAEGTINIFRNTGTAIHPNFSVTPSLTISLGAFYATVAARDLNGDGKHDLLVGNYSGGVRFYKNTTSAGVLSFSQTPFPLDGIDVGQSSAPCIADVDNDGIVDVLIGTSAGTLHFYKNVGTDSSPTFSLISSTFNSIDVGNDAVPFVIDIEGNGKSDLLIGNSDGKIFRYQYNSTTGQYDSITSQFAHIDVRLNASQALADIDSDGDLDLFVGNGKGGVFYFENGAVNAVVKKPDVMPTSVLLHQNYPNPFNSSTRIVFVLPYGAHIELSVFDLLGRKVETIVKSYLQSGEHSVFWSAANLPSGIYFYRLSVLSKNASPVTTTRSMLYLK